MVITCNDSARLAEFEGLFDVVAVDAPCSGEGMFRKSEDACEQWSEGNVAMCAERQWEILQNAFRALRAGGVLLYSTCTFNRSEDEDILRRACEEFGEELEPSEAVVVRDDWGVVTGQEGVFKTFRFFPHRITGEGMFMAVARKSAAVKESRRLPKARRKAISLVDKRSAEELQRWLAEGDKFCFFEAGDTLYGCRKSHYEEIEALSGRLAVIYSGVAMGQIFKGKLKPDWALSQYVALERKAVATEELDEARALDYLRKRDIAVGDMVEGINLVTHKGRALGFAKKVGARCNNLYPNSLKIMNM
jgi:NOL1/NOP2/fmu family ribosome biogenesis protein